MKNLFIKYLVVIVLVGLAIWQASTINKYKKDNQRLEYVISNVNQQIDSVKDKNGEYHQTINVLTLKSSELSKINSGLQLELENMKIKIKNLQNATVIVPEYVYKTDTVKTTIFVREKNSWLSNIENPYVTASWVSTVDSLTNNLIVTDYQTQFNDTIITATEIIYKGWWFWRKPKEIKLHLKSTNPYSNFKDIQSIKFSK